jgi:uncharacterized protein
MLRHLLPTVAFMALCYPVFSGPAFADCVGENLLETMPQDQRVALQARADAQPFAQGNYWRATKGAADITLIGTYHLGDARHAATMTAIEGDIAEASLLLVEAGPEEEAQLMERMADDPRGMLITSGPSLMEQLPADDWARLASAMSARQIPGFMAAKFQPWYVSVLLSVPPCAMASLAEKNGLDFQIMAKASTENIPIRALEPYDTVLQLFGGMTPEEQIEMLQTALVMEDRAADSAITLADAYFAQNSLVIWELMQEQALGLPDYTPERVAEEFAMMEERLINARNRAWIPVLEAAAAEGPVFAAFGALHLAGDEGVLNLLAQQGWVLERLPL